MARRTTVELIDDIDGGAADETIEFSVNGKAWIIDLNTTNAQQFYEQLDGWQRYARRAGSGRTAAPSRKHDPEFLNRVREWARENGHEVSDRGRIKGTIMDAYREAHG